MLLDDSVSQIPLDSAAQVAEVAQVMSTLESFASASVYLAIGALTLSLLASLLVYAYWDLHGRTVRNRTFLKGWIKSKTHRENPRDVFFRTPTGQVPSCV